MKRMRKKKEEENDREKYINKALVKYKHTTHQMTFYRIILSTKEALQNWFSQSSSEITHHQEHKEVYEQLIELMQSRGDISIYYKEKYGRKTDLADKLFLKMDQIDKRTLLHSLALEKHEAKIERLEKGKRASVDEEVMPQYLSEDFERLRGYIENLESAGENKSKILYYLMEAEVVLGELEEKARCTDRKYEARLAASLRDICKLHEPNDISEEQISVFVASNRALMDGLGKLNREKLAWIRSELLKVGLTWLPVTEKAAKEVSKAQSMTE